MNYRTVLPSLALITLAGCAGLPSPEKLAALPLVTYPEQPPAGDFIYKLPAGKPIDLHILADGSLLAGGIDQKVSASLARDLYLHKRWASEDGREWRDARDLVGIKLRVTLPSYETPGPGEIHLSVDRKGP